MAKCFLKIMHGRRLKSEKWKNQEKQVFSKNNIEKRINDFLIFSKTERFFEEDHKEDW